MITITKATSEVVAKEPFIEELMSEGLINLSALARKIKPDVEKKLMKKVNESAIIMALKRQGPILDYRSINMIKKLTLITGDITIRSKLTDYTFENSNTINQCHKSLIEVVSSQKDIFYTYSKGVQETTIILSDTISELAEQIFKKELMLDKTGDLSSLTIKLPKKNKTQPGLYYFILKNIAQAGVNIFEVISTTHEFTLIVKDKDIDSTFSVIKNL